MQKQRPLALVMSLVASLPLAAIALYAAGLTPRRAIANDAAHPPAAVHCAELASDPRNGLRVGLPLDFAGSGLDRQRCERRDHHGDRDGRH